MRLFSSLDGWITQQVDIYFFFTSSLCKTLMRFCFVSVIKRGIYCNLNFNSIFWIFYWEKPKITKNLKNIFLMYLCYFRRLFQRIKKKKKKKKKYIFIFSDLIIIVEGRWPIWKLKIFSPSNPFFFNQMVYNQFS